MYVSSIKKRLKFLKEAVLITAVAAHYYCYQIEGIVFELLVTNGVTSEGRINLQTNDIKKIWLTKQRLICWKCNFQDGEAPVEIVFVLAATFYLLCDLLELFLLGQNIHMAEHASWIVNIINIFTRPKLVYGRQGLAGVSLRAFGAQLRRGKWSFFVTHTQTHTSSLYICSRSCAALRAADLD